MPPGHEFDQKIHSLPQLSHEITKDRRHAKLSEAQLHVLHVSKIYQGCEQYGDVMWSYKEFDSIQYTLKTCTVHGKSYLQTGSHTTNCRSKKTVLKHLFFATPTQLIQTSCHPCHRWSPTCFSFIIRTNIESKLVHLKNCCRFTAKWQDKKSTYRIRPRWSCCLRWLVQSCLLTAPAHPPRLGFHQRKPQQTLPPATRFGVSSWIVLSKRTRLSHDCLQNEALPCIQRGRRTECTAHARYTTPASSRV